MMTTSTWYQPITGDVTSITIALIYTDVMRPRIAADKVVGSPSPTSQGGQANECPDTDETQWQ
jgi:hypothetical protein